MNLDEMKTTADRHPDDRWRRLIALYEGSLAEKDSLQAKCDEAERERDVLQPLAIAFTAAESQMRKSDAEVQRLRGEVERLKWTIGQATDHHVFDCDCYLCQTLHSPVGEPE
jgi:hypothetical protein